MKEERAPQRSQPDPGEMMRCGMGLLACYTALIVARARQSIDIDVLLIKLKTDLDFVADHCPEVGEAMEIIASQVGGDGDTIDPGRAAGKLQAFRRRLACSFLPEAHF